jgi:hypothetical protein
VLQLLRGREPAGRRRSDQGFRQRAEANSHWRLQVGMRTFHKLKNHFHCPIINLDKIWTLVGEEVRACRSLDHTTCSLLGGLGRASERAAGRASACVLVRDERARSWLCCAVRHLALPLAEEANDAPRRALRLRRTSPRRPW